MGKENYVYLHIKLTNGEPFYVGKGKDNRAFDKRQRSKWWNNIVNKYGYDIIFIEKGLTNDEAIEREIYWIDRIGRKDKNKGPLVNMTDGGEGFRGKHTEESKKKISINNARGFSGKSHSDESKKKISEKNIGNSNANDNKKTEAGLKKISETSKGNTYMKGKTHSDEVKNKISESRKGKNTKIVYKFDLNGNLINEYESLNKAAELNKTTTQMISRVCRGIRNKHNDYIWSYNKLNTITEF